MTSISVAPPQAALSNTRSSNASSSSSTSPATRSFASHLKESSNEDDDHTTTEPVGPKKVLLKDDKEVQRQKRETTAAVLSIPVTTQHVQDPRDMLPSLQKDGSKGDAATAANTIAAAPVEESKSASPKSPVAFSVALPKITDALKEHLPEGGAAFAPADKAPHGQKNSAGGKQNSDSSDSRDAWPAAKDEALDTAPKTTAFANAVHAADAPSGVITGMQQSQHTPYLDAHLGRAASAPAATEVVRTTDLPPTPVSRPPQSIDLKVAGADNSQVDVRVSQRAGDVQVTVRTPDGDLAQSLRQHLPELSDRLAQTGVNSEIWHPGTSQVSTDTTSNQESWNSDQSQAQQQQQQRNPENQSNPSKEENGGSWNWQNEFTNAEKEDR